MAVISTCFIKQSLNTPKTKFDGLYNDVTVNFSKCIFLTLHNWSENYFSLIEYYKNIIR